MIDMETFQKKYPKTSKQISGFNFEYRYYKHPSSTKTLVLLTGGIGLSDLLLLHFEEFTKNFSVITFDYQIDFKDNAALADAIGELLKSLNIKAYLVGQSLGGLIAQIIAKRHPDVVEGLILSNTGSLEADINAEGNKCLQDMLLRCKKNKRSLRFIPFSLFKKMTQKAIMKKFSSLTPDESALVQSFSHILFEQMNKKYEFHMIDLLVDIGNFQIMNQTDFLPFKGKVLLILSEDDQTFNQDVKNSLIHLMPQPKVVTNITGGHLALLLHIDNYASLVRSFIQENN